MASIREAARAIDKGFATIQLNPASDLNRLAQRERRRPPSMNVAAARVRRSLSQSFPSSTTGR